MQVGTGERSGAASASPRPWPALLGLALLSGATCGPAAAADQTVTVMLDRAQVMSYPPATETVIVGNPIIADVTLLKNSGKVVLTGRGFGDTNLLFLDGRGTVLEQAELRVREPPAMMVVQRGTDRETYACHPRCQATVTLGDSPAFLKEAMGDIQARNALASGAAIAASGPAR